MCYLGIYVLNIFLFAILLFGIKYKIFPSTIFHFNLWRDSKLGWFKVDYDLCYDSSLRKGKVHSMKILSLTDGGTSYRGYPAKIIQVTETLSCVCVTWSLENEMGKALAFVLLPSVRGWFCLDARYPPSYSITSPSPVDREEKIRQKTTHRSRKTVTRAKMEGCTAGAGRKR